MRCDVDGFDAGMVKWELKVMTLEFWAMIVCNVLGARVTQQPMIFEKEGSFMAYGCHPKLTKNILGQFSAN